MEYLTTSVQIVSSLATTKIVRPCRSAVLESMRMMRPSGAVRQRSTSRISVEAGQRREIDQRPCHHEVEKHQKKNLLKFSIDLN